MVYKKVYLNQPHLRNECAALTPPYPLSYVHLFLIMLGTLVARRLSASLLI